MSYPIEEIEGIGPSYGKKLTTAGIKTSDDLLTRCCDPKGRKTTAEKTGIGEKTLLGWANMADLMRVKGVGRQFAELLEGSGVDTIKELRTRNAENLATKMKAVNDTKKLAKVAPSVKTITDWIQSAKTMEPKITY